MSEADRGHAASTAAQHADKPQHPPTAAMSRETTGSSSPRGQSQTGEHPPTAVMGGADQAGAAATEAERADKPQHPPTAVMNREASGSSPPAEPGQAMKHGETGKQMHPPTAAMNRETPGAASPQDVQRQTQGEPTAAGQVQGQISRSHEMARAMAELERARLFDRQGEEAECLQALGRAKLLVGQ
jgi:hypothetical protein